MELKLLPRSAAGVLVGAAALLAVPGTSAVAAPPTPTPKISDVKTAPGVVQYLFSVSGLGQNRHLDAGSVVVRAGNETLDATAGTPNAATIGPVKAPPREVILTLDVSGSMQGDGITAARAAAVSYARSLPSDVQIGVLIFSDKPRLLLKPTLDRASVVAAIQAVRAGGNTSLFDAVIQATSELHSLPADATKRLLILSDGDDTVSTHSLNDALAALSSQKVSADVVAFRLPGNHAVLDTIASKSGGKVLAANEANDLAGAFAAAAEQFDQQLLITVKVPDDLANTATTLLTSLNAGDTSVSAPLDVTLPSAAGAGPHDSLKVSAPSASTSNTMLFLMCAVAFVAFLLAALVFVYLPVQGRARAQQNARLAEVQRYQLIGALGAGPTDIVAPKAPSEGQFSQRALSFVDRTVRAGGRRERIVDELERAGMRLRPEEWVVFQAAGTIVGGAIFALLFHSIFGLPIGGIAAYAGFRGFLAFRIQRRSTAFIDQMPDTLQLIAGSLRSGFALNQAIVGIVREGTEPTASEFSRALTEARLGANLEDALDAVATRMQCVDLHWVVMAIRISREVGGNLAEVLQNTVGTMRDRAQLRGQVKVLSAEGRISARILIGLPFMMAAYLLVFKKGYLNPLVHTGVGIGLLSAGSLLLVLGAIWVRKLVKIEV